MTTCEDCWAHSELTGESYEATVRKAERDRWPCTKNTEEGARLRAGQFWDSKRKVDMREAFKPGEEAK